MTHQPAPRGCTPCANGWAGWPGPAPVPLRSVLAYYAFFSIFPLLLNVAAPAPPKVKDSRPRVASTRAVL
ncbi:MAG: hypothetical protein SFU83_11220 [Meiothermus sp.]|nr:hypothetical protein [Meiothermus sp.]